MVYRTVVPFDTQAFYPDNLLEQLNRETCAWRIGYKIGGRPANLIFAAVIINLNDAKEEIQRCGRAFNEFIKIT